MIKKSAKKIAEQYYQDLAAESDSDSSRSHYNHYQCDEEIGQEPRSEEFSSNSGSDTSDSEWRTVRRRKHKHKPRITFSM